MDIGVLEPGQEPVDGLRYRVLADLMVDEDEPASRLGELDVVLNDRILQIAYLSARPAGAGTGGPSPAPNPDFGGLLCTGGSGK